MAHLPKYERIKQQLLAEMRSGHYPVGGRLPTREELIRHYGVTRTTVNQALRELVAQGVLATSKRGGTVYTGKEPPRDVAVVASGVRFSANGALGESLEALVLLELLAHSSEFNIHWLNPANLNFERPEWLLDYHATLLMMPPDELLVKIREYGERVLVFNRYGDEFNFISTNHRAAVRRMAVRNLEAAEAGGSSGEAALFVLRPTVTQFVLRERIQGFFDACAERGRTYGVIELAARSSFDEALTALRKVQFPEGRKIVLASPQISWTGAVIRLAHERNWKIGRDLFYSDFDNPYGLRNTGEPVVSAVQDYRQMSEVLPDALHAMARGERFAAFVDPAFVPEPEAR